MSELLQKLDLTKPVRTKDGRNVRVLQTDRPGPYPVVGIIDADKFIGEVASWTVFGQYEDECRGTKDLVQDAPPPAECDDDELTRLRDALERAGRLLSVCSFDAPEDLDDLTVIEDAVKLLGRE